MSRIPRIVVPGFPHHVTQRGNRRSNVFETDDDRKAYLRFLVKYSRIRGLSIWAYCLMSNHVHLIAVPESEASLSEGLRDAHTGYALYFNARTELSGHLWQGRFHSTALDDAHLWAAVRYVELNPVRAGIVARAEEYPWSSAPAHCGLRADGVLSPGLPLIDSITEWTEWLHEPIDAEQALFTHIRRQTHTGRPCGSAEFIERLETTLDRPIKARPRGPKPGTKYRKFRGQTT